MTFVCKIIFMVETIANIIKTLQHSQSVQLDTLNAIINLEKRIVELEKQIEVEEQEIRELQYIISQKNS